MIEVLTLMYQHPFATFFFLVAIAGIVSSFRPFARDCDHKEEEDL